MLTKSRKSLWVGLSMLGAVAAGNATAGPLLQLYIEGATYDAVQESWYYPGHHFRLWAIADLSGNGGSDGLPITDVRLAAVYDSSADPVTITITPARIGDNGDYLDFTDPSMPGEPQWLQTVSDGSRPLIGGSHRLPNHGEYGNGKTWQEFGLSDFTTPDSQLPDFLQDIPVPGAGFAAQIHAYDVHVDGADAHFDLYARIENERGHISYIFAPPSHDATDGPESVPVPATLALLGIGAVALSISRRKKRIT
jgi:hypothetical protein